ncbi:MAG: YicC family protein [Gemmatimonadota bacterium]|nr:MAG: YicC family protein [Gemmatimonadota bacterium]
MPRSMTGYGVAEGDVNEGRLQVEVRSVNHRHFAASLKLCTPLQSLEADLRNRLRDRIARGHVTLSARWIEQMDRGIDTRVNLERAQQVVDALRELQTALDLPGQIDLGFVARQPEVFTVANSEEIEIDPGAVLAVVDEAVGGLLSMREREGEALGQELRGQLEHLELELAKIEAKAPARLVAERDRLRESVAQLLDGRKLDEDRLCQEIALIADKLDITEEMVRLNAHIGACRETIGSEAPMGRQLTFLGQEMLREINTIGSKANDAVITESVITMKGTIEKFREQVENVE